jgi:hypothetical protein
VVTLLARRVARRVVGRCVRRRGGEHGDPDLGGAAALGVAGFPAQPPGVLEHAERALDLASFLVAAVLFPDPLCGRRRRRPTMTGANGQVVAFSGT